MSEDLRLGYWQAVAELPSDRAGALAQLERVFTDADPPEGLVGPHRGRLLTTTVVRGLDGAFMGLTRLWMPWKGKTFDPEAKEGRNLFSSDWRVAMRVLWPSHTDVRDEGSGLVSTFRFTTWQGPSAISPDTAVLKIDYDHEGSPGFPVRQVLDELVRVDDGLYLGQALMRWRGEFHRAAWFSLAA